MYEHIKVMKKIVLTNIWGTTGFTVQNLIHVFKESSASSALKTEKKHLMLQVWKFVISMAQIFTTFQHVLRVLQTSISSFTKFFFLDSLVREEGEDSSALFFFFWNWKERPCLLRKMPKLQASMGKFLIKKAVLGVPGWKNP